MYETQANYNVGFVRHLHHRHTSEKKIEHVLTIEVAIAVAFEFVKSSLG